MGFRGVTKRRRVVTGVIGLALVATTLLVGARPAQAIVSLDVAVNFGTSTVGSGGTGTIKITNASSLLDALLGSTTLNNITLVPSCGQAVNSGDCPSGSRELGIYNITGATGTAGACNGVAFAPSVLDAAQGKLKLTPASAITLTKGLLVAGATDSCTIGVTYSTLKLPFADASFPTVGHQTAQLVTVSGTNGTTGNSGSGRGNGFGTLKAAPPKIAVAVTPTPTTRPAPGGQFTYNVVVTNLGTSDLALNSLIDSVYGNLRDKGTCTSVVGSAIFANGGTYSCAFDGSFTGATGASQTNRVTAEAYNVRNELTNASGEATVSLTAGSGQPTDCAATSITLPQTWTAKTAAQFNVAGSNPGATATQCQVTLTAARVSTQVGPNASVTPATRLVSVSAGRTFATTFSATAPAAGTYNATACARAVNSAGSIVDVNTANDCKTATIQAS